MKSVSDGNEIHEIMDVVTLKVIGSGRVVHSKKQDRMKSVNDGNEI